MDHGHPVVSNADRAASPIRGNRTIVITVVLTPDSPSNERRRVATFADEEGDLTAASFTKWGTLAMLAFAYVAIGAWDWTDTVEALERCLLFSVVPDCFIHDPSQNSVEAPASGRKVSVPSFFFLEGERNVRFGENVPMGNDAPIELR